MGIHRPMRLHWFSAPVLTEVVPKIRVVSLASRVFSVAIAYVIHNPQPTHADANTNTTTTVCVEVTEEDGAHVASTRVPVTLVGEVSEHHVTLNVSGVQLWWPNEMGQQYMYNVVVSLCSDDSHHHHRHRDTGSNPRVPPVEVERVCASGAFTEQMCKRIGFREVGLSLARNIYYNQIIVSSTSISHKF